MSTVRIVTVDFHTTPPIRGLDPLNSEFRGSAIVKVPVLRVFGTTDEGLKACLHIHGVFPYIYVPYDSQDNPNTVAYQMANALDKALNISMGQASSSQQHIYKIELVSGFPMYGYHTRQHRFLKISFYNPLMIKKACVLLQNGSVLGKTFQPHESHIPYHQQFMIDYNLHGMNSLRLSKVQSRTPSTRDSVCQMEMDGVASDILNRLEVSQGKVTSNPGIQYICEDEKQRRRNKGVDTQLEPCLTQNRIDVEPTVTHTAFKKVLQAKLQEKISGDSILSDSSVYPAETPSSQDQMNDTADDSLSEDVEMLMEMLRENQRLEAEPDSILSQTFRETEESDDEQDLTIPLQSVMTPVKVAPQEENDEDIWNDSFFDKTLVPQLDGNVEDSDDSSVRYNLRFRVIKNNNQSQAENRPQHKENVKVASDSKNNVKIAADPKNNVNLAPDPQNDVKVGPNLKNKKGPLKGNGFNPKNNLKIASNLKNNEAALKTDVEDILVRRGPAGSIAISDIQSKDVGIEQLNLYEETPKLLGRRLRSRFITAKAINKTLKEDITHEAKGTNAIIETLNSAEETPEATGTRTRRTPAVKETSNEDNFNPPEETNEAKGAIPKRKKALNGTLNKDIFNALEESLEEKEVRTNRMRAKTKTMKVMIKPLEDIIKPPEESHEVKGARIKRAKASNETLNKDIFNPPEGTREVKGVKTNRTKAINEILNKDIFNPQEENHEVKGARSKRTNAINETVNEDIFNVPEETHQVKAARIERKKALNKTLNEDIFSRREDTHEIKGVISKTTKAINESLKEDISNPAEGAHETKEAKAKMKAINETRAEDIFKTPEDADRSKGSKTKEITEQRKNVTNKANSRKDSYLTEEIDFYVRTKSKDNQKRKSLNQTNAVKKKSSNQATRESSNQAGRESLNQVKRKSSNPLKRKSFNKQEDPYAHMRELLKTMKQKKQNFSKKVTNETQKSSLPEHPNITMQEPLSEQKTSDSNNEEAKGPDFFNNPNNNATLTSSKRQDSKSPTSPTSSSLPIPFVSPFNETSSNLLMESGSRESNVAKGGLSAGNNRAVNANIDTDTLPEVGENSFMIRVNTDVEDIFTEVTMAEATEIRTIRPRGEGRIDYKKLCTINVFQKVGSDTCVNSIGGNFVVIKNKKHRKPVKRLINNKPKRRNTGDWSLSMPMLKEWVPPGPKCKKSREPKETTKDLNQVSPDKEAMQRLDKVVSQGGSPKFKCIPKTSDVSVKEKIRLNLLQNVLVRQAAENCMVTSQNYAKGKDSTPNLLLRGENCTITSQNYHQEVAGCSGNIENFSTFVENVHARSLLKQHESLSPTNSLLNRTKLDLKKRDSAKKIEKTPRMRQDTQEKRNSSFATPSGLNNNYLENLLSENSANKSPSGQRTFKPKKLILKRQNAQEWSVQFLESPKKSPLSTEKLNLSSTFNEISNVPSNGVAIQAPTRPDFDVFNYCFDETLDYEEYLGISDDENEESPHDLFRTRLTTKDIEDLLGVTQIYGQVDKSDDADNSKRNLPQNEDIPQVDGQNDSSSDSSVDEERSPRKKPRGSTTKYPTLNVTVRSPPKSKPFLGAGSCCNATKQKKSQDSDTTMIPVTCDSKKEGGCLDSAKRKLSFVPQILENTLIEEKVVCRYTPSKQPVNISGAINSQNVTKSESGTNLKIVDGQRLSSVTQSDNSVTSDKSVATTTEAFSHNLIKATECDNNKNSSQISSNDGNNLEISLEKSSKHCVLDIFHNTNSNHSDNNLFTLQEVQLGSESDHNLKISSQKSTKSCDLHELHASNSNQCDENLTPVLQEAESNHNLKISSQKSVSQCNLASVHNLEDLNRSEIIFEDPIEEYDQTFTNSFILDTSNHSDDLFPKEQEELTEAEKYDITTNIAALPGPSKAAQQISQSSTERSSSSGLLTPYQRFQTPASSYESLSTTQLSLHETSDFIEPPSDGTSYLAPKFNPPSVALIKSTLAKYNLPEIRSKDPFYSEAKHVTGSVEVGSSVLKIKSKMDAPDLTSFADTQRRRLQSLHTDLDFSKNINELKLAYCSQDEYVIEPVRKPPSRREAELWLQARKIRDEAKVEPAQPNQDLDESTPEASLQQILDESRLFAKESINNSRRITGMDRSNDFKLSLENLQQARSYVIKQYLTSLVMELHVQTRGNFKPDPQHDAIRAIFYSVMDDDCTKLGIIAVNTLNVSPGKNSSDNILDGTGIDCDVIYVTTENELYIKFLELIRNWDPDIFIGYEIQMSSWGYLIDRGYTLGINYLTQLSRIPNHTPFKQDEESHDLNITGRVVLDLWRLMRHEIALQSYTFENIVYHVLHERAPLYSLRDLTNWWLHRNPKMRHRTVDFYLYRVQRILRVIDNFDLIGRTSELARLFGILFYEVLSRGSQFRVESMMLRLAKPLGFIPVSPSVQQRAKMRAPEYLPLILEPESKFYTDPVIVLDFQSLYPSVIIAYNYCFSTCIGRVEHLGTNSPFEFGATQLKISRATVERLLQKNKLNFSPCGVGFVTKDVRHGILPRMLQEILDTRLLVKQSMKDEKGNKLLQRVLHSRQLGLKLIANVTYGYTAANFSGRMPAVEIGDSVVAKGRETLQRAIGLVESNEEWGVRVVYGDTDSMFVLVPGRSREDAFKIGAQIAEAVTNSNPSPIRLKLEKVYQPCILQTKKRYVGYMYEHSEQAEPEYEAKGIETVRRDGCPAVTKMLEKCLRLLFETCDVSLVRKYVERQFHKLLAGRASIQDLTFAKEYRGMAGYKPGACVPALELVRKWKSVDPRNEPRSGERVPYVIINGPPGLPLIKLVRSPRELLEDPALRPNALYYIRKAIIPPINRCFLLIGADVNTWFNEMPRKHTQYLPTAVSPSKGPKTTISQYFATTSCICCGQQTKEGVCAKCWKDKQLTAVILHEKVRIWERNYYETLKICQSCCNRQTDLSCNSLDCPVLYSVYQMRKDLQQSNYVRDLINKLPNLEF